MAADFEILSQLSGMGTATIRVKPKAENISGSVKEQILRVTVRGVEREVTLVQNYGTPPPVVTEEYIFNFID